MKYLNDYLVSFRCFTYGKTSTKRQQQRLKGQANNLFIDLFYTILLFNTLTIYSVAKPARQFGHAMQI